MDAFDSKQTSLTVQRVWRPLAGLGLSGQLEVLEEFARHNSAEYAASNVFLCAVSLQDLAHWTKVRQC